MDQMVAEPGRMAKTQKTFYLNPELEAVIEAITNATGATFTKIVTCALLHYLFRDFPRSDPKWMSLAVALEKGDVSLSQVCIAAIQYRLDRVTSLLEVEKPTEPFSSAGLKLEKTDLNYAKKQLQGAMGEATNDLDVVIAALTGEPFGEFPLFSNPKRSR